MLFKSCPKFRGDLLWDKGYYGAYLQWFQCGMTLGGTGIGLAMGVMGFNLGADYFCVGDWCSGTPLPMGNRSHEGSCLLNTTQLPSPVLLDSLRVL